MRARVKSPCGPLKAKCRRHTYLPPHANTTTYSDSTDAHEEWITVSRHPPNHCTSNCEGLAIVRQTMIRRTTHQLRSLSRRFRLSPCRSSLIGLSQNLLSLDCSRLLLSPSQTHDLPKRRVIRRCFTDIRGAPAAHPTLRND